MNIEYVFFVTTASHTIISVTCAFTIKIFLIQVHIHINKHMYKHINENGLKTLITPVVYVDVATNYELAYKHTSVAYTWKKCTKYICKYIYIYIYIYTYTFIYTAYMNCIYIYFTPQNKSLLDISLLFHQ